MPGAVELTIEDVAFGGNGVARHEGKVVFVPFTIERERVSARVTREKKKFAEAELLSVLEPSTLRVQPQCPYFGRCGGCSYQHIDYRHQLEIKARQVEQTLRRIARLDHVPMRPIVASPAEYGYRNRITVHAEDRVIGFYRRDEHRLIDVEVCPISRPEVNRALTALRAGPVRDGHYSLRADEGPRVFAQTNDAVAEELARIVCDFVPPSQSLLIDAYCGSGFLAKRLLHRAHRVVGIDWDRFAIAAAQRDATANETYLAGDIDEHLGAVLKQGCRETTTVIVDPPATGLTTQSRELLLSLPPATLVYVSCNPSTLARDLSALVQRFTIESVTPLDMFPQTAEIEVAVHLRQTAIGLAKDG
jgi:23S rRNA (uracil1939-C5)-methyltransferase